jgi:hypothetical protein
VAAATFPKTPNHIDHEGESAKDRANRSGGLAMIEFMSHVTFEFAASAVSAASRPEVPYRELHASASVDGESAIIWGDVATD